MKHSAFVLNKLQYMGEDGGKTEGTQGNGRQDRRDAIQEGCTRRTGGM